MRKRKRPVLRRIEFNNVESNNIESRAEAENVSDISNFNKNHLRQSGNSDVDVKVDVHVDTTAIGFAILSSLLATKQLNAEEFQIAVNKLEELTRKNFLGQDINDQSNLRLFNKRTI